MLDLGMTSVLFLLVGAVAASTVIYYVLRIVREWLRRNRPTGDPTPQVCRARFVSRCAHLHPMD